jgi:hypothetical protein
MKFFELSKSTARWSEANGTPACDWSGFGLAPASDESLQGPLKS